MIWYPKPKQYVKIHYRKSMVWMPYHGKYGVVIKAGHGPGPHNALVGFTWKQQKVIIPRGNLVDATHIKDEY